MVKIFWIKMGAKGNSPTTYQDEIGGNDFFRGTQSLLRDRVKHLAKNVPNSLMKRLMLGMKSLSLM